MKNRIRELYALEQLASGSTFIHRLNPLVKILSSAVFIVTVVSFNRYAFARLLPYVLYPMLLMALSETPYSMLMKRFLIALPFCLFAGAGNVLFDRTAALTIYGITISYCVVSLITILFKTWLCVMAFLLLISLTPFPDFAGGMIQLRIPGIFIIMFEMTYRYIAVLFDEVFSMSTAYSLRSSGRKGIAMRDMGSFAGQLLIRSFDRADRIYNAMKCRGFSPRNIPQNNKKPETGDIAFLVIVCLPCVTFRFIDVNLLLAEFLGSLP